MQPTNGPPSNPAVESSRKYFDGVFRQCAELSTGPFIFRPTSGLCFTQLRLAQIEPYKMVAVEWHVTRVITPAHDFASSPTTEWTLRRTELDSDDWFARSKDRPEGDMVPRFQEWSIPFDEKRYEAVVQRLRSVPVPVLMGRSRAPSHAMPECILQIGGLGTAYATWTDIRWCNPRKGEWEPLITLFHHIWYEWEALLDGRKLRSPFVPPPRGGLNECVKYVEYLKEHPIRRTASKAE